MKVPFDEEVFKELYPTTKNDDLAKIFKTTKKQILTWRKWYGLRKTYGDQRNSTRDRFNDPRYQEWRLSVLSRDGFKCRHCSRPARDRKVGIGLDCHHIASWSLYPELRYTTDNGISLCRACHKRLHRQLRKKPQ